MEPPTSTPSAPHSGGIACVAHEANACWLLPGRRLVLGSSRRCDLALPGPGIAPRHVRLALRPDGWIAIRTIGDATVRLGSRRLRGHEAVAPGTTLGVGLCSVTLTTGSDNFLVRLGIAWRDTLTSVREARRHLPWWGLSLALHAILVLLFLGRQEDVPRAQTRGLELRLADATEESDGEHTMLVPEEPAPVVLPQLADTEQPPVPVDPVAVAYESGETLPAAGAAGDPATLRSALFDDIGRSRGTQATGQIPKGVSKTFATDLEKLRSTGLEVVLCFDSTSSMGSLLADAKRDLREIVELLAELVPSARVALLTYRDKGDAYVTRQTRLGLSLWEALAFLSSVRADGGGDFEEAVDVALEEAARLDWSTRSKKVVVLAGDAPPHEYGLPRAVAAARRLKSRDGQVHCLLVGNEPKTRGPFERIAKAGAGRTLRREDRDQLSLQLLELAFGSEARGDLEQLLAERRVTRGRRLMASRLPSANLLAATLRSPGPDSAIVEAWTQAPREAFLDVRQALEDQRLSVAGGFALCYLLNMALEQHGLLAVALEPRAPRRGAVGLPAEIVRSLETLAGGRRLRRGR